MSLMFQSPRAKSAKVHPKIHSRTFAPADIAKYGRYYKDKPKLDATDGDYDSPDGPEVCCAYLYLEIRILLTSTTGKKLCLLPLCGNDLILSYKLHKICSV